MGIQAFFIRGGQNWGHRSFFPAHTDDVPEDEVLTAFLTQFYEEVPPARTVLLDRELAEGALLTEALGERAGYKVALSVPQRGDRRRLMEQAKRNAVEALDRRLAESTTQAKLLREVADLFELAEPPDRIEIYDNSHIQGTNALGAMVVAGPEGFRKGQYRKFNIKDRDRARRRFRDDARSVRPPLRPRAGRGSRPRRGDWPDLVLIDGGRGQLNAVKGVLEEMGIEDVCLVGVAKGPRSRPRGARGVPLDGRARTDAAGQRAGAVLPPAPARRGPPLRDRRAPGEARRRRSARRRSTKCRASARRGRRRC